MIVADSEKYFDLARLAEAEHCYRNSLQLLGSLTRLRIRQAPGPEARAALSYVAEMIDVLSDLHRSNSSSEPGDIADRLTLVCRRWQRLCADNVSILLEAERGVPLDPKDATIASLIAQEFVVNAIKHAFPDHRKGTVIVRFSKRCGRLAVLEVLDDGVGLTEPSPRAGPRDPNRGASLVDMFSGSLRGTVTKDPCAGKGLAVRVSWPI